MTDSIVFKTIFTLLTLFISTFTLAQVPVLCGTTESEVQGFHIEPDGTLVFQEEDVCGNGGGGEEPVECPAIPSVLSPQTIQDFSSAFGVQFGENFGQKAFSIFNDGYGFDLVRTQLRSFRFTAPPDSHGNLWVDVSSGNPFSLSISKECPGVFRVADGVASTCIRTTSNAALGWATDGTMPSGKCQLEAGKTYYLNIAYLNRNYLNQNPPVYYGTCNVATSSNCTFVFTRGDGT